MESGRYVVFFSFLAAKKVPDGLMLGAGSAAYQIEGGWDADGKGPSQWDVFTRENNLPENAEIAADSYHKWREDLEYVKRLGLDFYRFSISWPRILPNGTINNINQKGVDYYMNIINALKAAGIEPIITIYHWDMPQHIDQLGGFLNPQIVDYLEDYARLAYTLFGPYVKYWLTINEPNSICQMTYGIVGTRAPGPRLEGDGIYQCAYNLLKAHARMYRVYDEEFRAKYNGKLSIVLNTEWREPETNSSLDLEAQERALQFVLGWFANPIYIGNWPQVMIDRIGNRSRLEGFARSRLPQFSQEEIDYIKGTHDYFAFNTYGTNMVRHQGDAPINNYPHFNLDLGVNVSISVLSDPVGHRRLINYLNKRYNPKAIMNTENGYMTSQDSLNDDKRITYLKEHISNVIDSIVIDKINVIGYSVWSLLDDYEWGTYSRTFGLIQVDFDSPNRTRTWKKSATWYQNLIATRTLDD